ncbi:hypothetical protein KSP39_PZI005273 [Platanthera zijinensis]|uniref:Uncharacterized protein n=1 Tax=Platanthera zijinensis TaxID=2320716 RepID=A0AAP0GBE4_9ASPA
MPMAPATRAQLTDAADSGDNTVGRLTLHDARLDALQASVDAIVVGQSAILSRLDALSAPRTPQPGSTSSTDTASLLGVSPTYPPAATPAATAAAAGRLSSQLDIPSFFGMDPLGWIARAEQFFDLHLT